MSVGTASRPLKSSSKGYARQHGNAKTAAMTNTLAIWIVAFIAGFFLLDHFVLHLGAPLFLARKGMDLLEYLAFWR